LYHAHTFEFMIIFLLPSLLVFSNVHKLTLRTHILGALIIAFPITKNGEVLISKFTTKADAYISTTESGHDLKASRFSQAINIIEQDSQNQLDILLFLPVGDSSDLILRTKMRTMSTHFSKYNFPRFTEMRTSRPLNIYCVYDQGLSKDQAFMESLNSKFPQQKEAKTILTGDVVVEKLILSATANG